MDPDFTSPFQVAFSDFLPQDRKDVILRGWQQKRIAYLYTHQGARPRKADTVIRDLDFCLDVVRSVRLHDGL